MEISIQDILGHWTEKLESALFGEQENLGNEDAQYFQSFFTESYVFPRNLLTYLKREIMLGFVFNIVVFLITIIYVPFNLDYCWACDSTITLWLGFLGLCNLVLVVPKIIIIPKLCKFDSDPDIFAANYGMWNFFRSRLYRFNMVISKYVLCTYLLGLALMLVIHPKEENCDRFTTLLWLIIGSYFIRTITSFIKFMMNVNNQQAENLKEYISGLSGTKIKSLRVVKYQEVAKSSEEELCSICYEEFKADENVRVMECQGDHYYHMKCIDKWLLKSDKCPKCNMEVFSKRNHEKMD